ncbi:MAG: chemotaxis response regulator protein-glutamate methylesterase [candidate division Zixibacteria bacterium]|nr:chemotaxis response regulator protein-glutamate methylesterase [candidate division Zixibacteria bacterium]
MSQVKVLVVDDSAFMRKAISMMLESDPDIKVVGMGHDGNEGIELVKKLKPDIVTLDIEMPRMDGLTALKHIMADNPTPVMMISSLTTDGASATLDALQLGAVDFIPKQLSFVALDIVKIKEQLIQKIKHIAQNKNRLLRQIRSRTIPKSPSSMNKRSSRTTGPTSILDCTGRKEANIVAIGASTGGPPALQAIIPRLPRNLPVPVVIVQHMPPTFTKSLADRLNSLSKVAVKEAEQSEPLKAGVVYISPGSQHLTVKDSSSLKQVRLSDEPSDTLHKPAVDVMMRSVANAYGSKTLGVILTGMGSDGLEGLKVVKQKGGKILAQNEDSCVVYGMPRSVVENKLANKVVHIDRMANEIMACF